MVGLQFFHRVLTLWIGSQYGIIFFCYQFYAPSNFYGHIRGGATWTILRAATQECKM